MRGRYAGKAVNLLIEVAAKGKPSPRFRKEGFLFCSTLKSEFPIGALPIVWICQNRIALDYFISFKEQTVASDLFNQLEN